MTAKGVVTTIVAVLCLAAVKQCVHRKSGIQLEGTEWKLVFMPGIPDSVRRGGTDRFTFLLDDSTGTVCGRSLCSRFAGRYRIKKSALGFDGMQIVHPIGPGKSGAFDRQPVGMRNRVDDARSIRRSGRSRVRRSMLRSIEPMHPCSPDAEAFDRRFRDMLDSVDGFEIRRKTLRLYCGERELAVFRPYSDPRETRPNDRAY